MKNITTNSYEDQQRRLQIKTINQQMKEIAIQGTGISPWEAQVLVDTIEEVYFSELNQQNFKPGQIKYQCLSADEAPGKPLKDCKMVSVILTLFDPQDRGNFSTDNNKDKSLELRKRRLVRLCEEAKDQGGFLTQEDLAEILMCDVRTIRRATKDLKKTGILLPTRGQQKDIGPGITHRAVAIRHWLEGKEPVEVAGQIKHSLAAVENYLQKFKRTAFLKRKGFTDFEIALTVGISVCAAKTFCGLYKEYCHKPFFRQRLEEINLVGSQYYQAQDEKKRIQVSKSSIKNERRLP